MSETLDSQEELYFHSILEDSRFLLDKPLDYDHGGVQRDLGKIADSMDEWEGRVAEELGLTVSEIAGIKTKYREELNLQTRAAIQRWQEKQGLNATYRNLIITFVKAEKGSYAKTVCSVLQAKDAKNNDKSPPPNEKQKSGEQYLEKPTPISRYATYLKGMYKHVSDEKIPGPSVACDKFIQLALVKKSKISRSQADKFTKATLHGNIDEILHEKEHIHIDDVLKPKLAEEKIKNVFVYGPPGIGKSTFVLEFCRRWDKNEDLRKYDLVVLLRLREGRVQQIHSVEDLFYHYDSSLQQAVSECVVKSEGENLLFVLDGFDELPVNQQRHSVIVDIIRGVCLPQSTVLLTTRPSAIADLCRIVKPQREFEIFGFTQVRIEQYASTMFASQPDMLSDFLTYIKANPAIRSMMYIPLNSAIVVEVYRANRTAGRPIPQTMTQLYSELCHVLLTRHLIDKGDPLANELPEKLEDLPARLYKPLLALAKLAYEGMENQELIFTKLPEECKGDHFGFMNASTELFMGYKAKLSFNFLHLTLQEFLAAFYITQCGSVEFSGEDLHKFDRYQSPYSIDWDMVKRFVSGLTGHVSWHSVTKSGSLTPVLVQCLYEAQSSIDYQSRMSFNGIEQTTLFDCYAVGWCIAKSKCSWHVSLRDCGLESEAVSMLAFGLNSSQGVCGSIRRLSLAGNFIREMGIFFLADFPQNCLQSISELILDDCELDFTALANVIPSLGKLKVLDISFNSRNSEGELVELFSALESLMYLEKLDAGSVFMTADDVIALSKLINTPSATIKGLSVGSEEMSSECVESMLQLLLSPSSLKTLIIRMVHVTSFEIAAPFRTVAGNISKLMLYKCGGIHFVLPHLAKCFSTNTGLKQLCIGLTSIPKSSTYYRLNEEETLSLIDALQQNHTLKKLVLNVPLSEDSLLLVERDERVEYVTDFDFDLHFH